MSVLNIDYLALRQEFEKQFLAESNDGIPYSLDMTEDGEYEDNEAECLWRAWVACAMAVETWYTEL